MTHAWGNDRILTFLKEGRELYTALYKGNKEVAIPPPRFISCWISEKCNLDCTYCYFSDTNADKTHTYIDTNRFIRWLGQAKAVGAESCEFSGGGEPTLHPEFTEIFMAAKMMGYHLGLITHACNPMPLAHLAANFKYVRCGLDAATAATHDAIKRNRRKDYWFHRAVENIKEMVRLRDEKETKDFTVGIKVVLNAVNKHELVAMINLAHELKVNYIQIKYEHSSDNAIPEEERIYLQGQADMEDQERFTKVRCNLFHARATTKCFMSPIHTVVTATGKILQCCFFEDRPIGTIFQEFHDVWGSDEHRRVVEMTTVEECDKLDCRWNTWNHKMREVIEDPLASVSFI